VIAESFERIHRSNLVGMGVLPLQFLEGQNAESLGLAGNETFSIDNVADIEPRQDVEVKVERADGSETTISARCRIDTYNELEYFRSGGILQYVLRRLAAA
jgi:aconitate hydratase